MRTAVCVDSFALCFTGEKGAGAFLSTRPLTEGPQNRQPFETRSEYPFRYVFPEMPQAGAIATAAVSLVEPRFCLRLRKGSKLLFDSSQAESGPLLAIGTS